MISIKLIIALCVIIFSIEMIVSVPTSKGKTDKHAKGLVFKCMKWDKHGMCLEFKTDDEAATAMDEYSGRDETDDDDAEEDVDKETEQVLGETQNTSRPVRYFCIGWDKKGNCIHYYIENIWRGK
eukprot:Seg5575.1 transcript_id=Seg5575.1/GoldUCD/mRNA.D3Y31 product="hypothetical protein" protein_id=Seg5575.1/GoldUCD/D3Y31